MRVVIKFVFKDIRIMRLSMMRNFSNFRRLKVSITMYAILKMRIAQLIQRVLQQELLVAVVEEPLKKSLNAVSAGRLRQSMITL
jgi:hypothetical protein